MGTFATWSHQSILFYYNAMARILTMGSSVPWCKNTKAVNKSSLEKAAMAMILTMETFATWSHQSILFYYNAMARILTMGSSAPWCKNTKAVNKSSLKKAAMERILTMGTSATWSHQSILFY